MYARGRSRTYEGTKPQDLKSCPFGHSGTLAYENYNKKVFKKSSIALFKRL